MKEGRHKKTVREVAAERAAGRTLFDQRLSEIKGAMPDKQQLVALEQIVDAVESLKSTTGEYKVDTVLSWIESLIQYGVDNLNEDKDLDYRVEIFRLYFALKERDSYINDSIDRIIDKIGVHRRDKEFATDVVVMLMDKLNTLKSVLTEKLDLRLTLETEKQEILKEIKRLKENNV